MEKFHLSFEFKGHPYQAVILMQGKSGGREFAVTELDEELGRLMSGNNIIREINGALEADALAEKREQTELKLIIASRLGEYLKLPCFVGGECLMPHAHIENWEEFHPLLRHEAHRSFVDDRSTRPAFGCAKGIGGLAVIFLLGLSVSLRAQDAYRVADPDIKVLGTSNLHNWSMEAKDVTCSVKFGFGSEANALPQSLTALDLAIPIHNLKSGESSMDSRAYTALKADKFGAITFTSASAVIVPGQKGQFQVKSTGTMTIAGVGRPVVLIVGCQVNADGSITCSGSQQLKMTDYQIKPPSFMLGALKTGDLLTINFSLILKK